jgi:hypothetical protein
MSDQEEALPEDAILWRRVPPYKRKLKEGTTDVVLPQGDAFRVSSDDDGVSVGIAAAFIAQGRGPEAMLDGDEFDDTWGVLEISMESVRDVGLDAEPDSSDHALLLPKPSGGKSSKLTAKSKWVVLPSSAGLVPRTPAT